jgi:hypothetical protein
LRLRATAGSEWIKFRSVRSVPAVLIAIAVVVVVSGMWVTAGFRSGWSTLTAGDRSTFDPTFQSLHGIELVIAAVAVGALARANQVTNSFVAVGGGAGAVQLVKQARALALHRDVPSRDDHPAPRAVAPHRPIYKTPADDREPDSHDMA